MKGWRFHCSAVQPRTWDFWNAHLQVAGGLRFLRLKTWAALGDAQVDAPSGSSCADSVPLAPPASAAATTQPSTTGAPSPQRARPL